jgi:hypothetical protein
VKALADGVKRYALEVAVHFAGLRNQQARTHPIGQAFIVRLLLHDEQHQEPGTLRTRTMLQMRQADRHVRGHDSV